MTTPPHSQPDRWRDVTPDDRAHDDATREFWGDHADWVTPSSSPTDDVIGRGEHETSTPGASTLGAKVARWWGSVSAGRNAETRSHTAAKPGAALPSSVFDEQDTSDIDSDDPDSEWDDRWETGPSPAPRPGVDPLLARFGGLAVVVTLLVPAFLGITSGSGGDETVRAASAPLQIPAPPVASSPSAPNRDAEVTNAPAEDPTPAAVTASTAVVAPAALRAETCGVEYDVAAGDFWIGIADRSGASLADLLAANNASVDTALFPGRSICLPDGATVPAPPATTVPATTTPTTAPPHTSTRTTSARATSPRSAPAGSVAPTTPTTVRPAAPPASNASPADVEAIIRAVWPDELEDRALEIAHRESNFSPTAKNSCCYGVFQIYWSVHKSWLAGLGVTSADQLYDPTLNARAALALYQRSGSWGPWGG